MTVSLIYRTGLVFAFSLMTAPTTLAQTSLFEPTASLSEPVNVTPSPLTIIEAFKAADTFNPRIQAAEQRLAIRETDVDLAFSAWKPIVEANASYGYLHQDNEFTRASSSTLNGDTTNIGVSLRQPLYRGGRIKNAFERSKKTADAAEVQITETRQQIFLEVANAFLGVERDKAILNLNEENLEILQDQLKANERRFELKDTSLTDVVRSKSAVASAYTRIATAKASYAESRSTFFRLTGRSPENLVSTDSISGLPGSMQSFMTTALRKNASIASAKLTVEAADYSVKEAKGARLPSIDFDSSVSRGHRPENFGPFSDDRVTTAASATVSIRIPIYQASQEFGNIRRAKQVRQFRELELSQIMAATRDEARIAWDRLQASSVALEFHEDAVRTAEIAAVGTRKIYKAGLISAIDLTDTEQTLLRTKIDYERAKQELKLNKYVVLSLMNEIDYN